MRHAEVHYFVGPSPTASVSEVPLTARGREQAAAAGRALAGVEFQRVITSGLPRTTETARLVLAERDDAGAAPAIEAWPEFEEFRGSRLDGIADDDIDDAFLPIFSGTATREATFLSGESIGSLTDRVSAALDRLLSDGSWQTALLVLHGGVNRAILTRALTDEPVFFGHLEQSSACINIIDCGPGYLVRAVNVTPYDPAQAGLHSSSIEEMAEQYRAYRGSR